MKIAKEEFKVIDFNINGVLNLDKNYQYFRMENPVEYGVQWEIAADFSIGYVNIQSAYLPKNKLDFSILCTFKSISRYKAILDNFYNEKEEMRKLANDLYSDISNEYNKRIQNTKMMIPFPENSELVLDQVCQRISASLHKSLENVREYLRKRE